jgi:hypothetical protein
MSAPLSQFEDYTVLIHALLYEFHRQGLNQWRQDPSHNATRDNAQTNPTRCSHRLSKCWKIVGRGYSSGGGGVGRVLESGNGSICAASNPGELPIWRCICPPAAPGYQVLKSTRTRDMGLVMYSQRMRFTGQARSPLYVPPAVIDKLWDSHSSDRDVTPYILVDSHQKIWKNAVPPSTGF